jgi:putative ATP-binding cassette transporter
VTIGRRFVQVSEDKNCRGRISRDLRPRKRREHCTARRWEEERDGIDKNLRMSCGNGRGSLPAHAHHAGFAGLSLIAPVCRYCCARRNFSMAALSLGQVMQAASAFTIVQTAFGWLVDNIRGSPTGTPARAGSLPR